MENALKNEMSQENALGINSLKLNMAGRPDSSVDLHAGKQVVCCHLA
jgi:hypothetical protein